MHGQLMVWVFFASLLVPVIGIAFCWGAWRGRPYGDARRRRIVQAGLVAASFSVLFAAMLPLVAMMPVHLREGVGNAVAGVGMVAGVAAPPLAAVLLGFGHGMERWLGIACVLLALAADLAMLVGAG